MNNVGTSSVDEGDEANNNQGEQKKIVDCAQCFSFSEIEIIGKPDCENLGIVANANADAEDIRIARESTVHQCARVPRRPLFSLGEETLAKTRVNFTHRQCSKNQNLYIW